MYASDRSTDRPKEHLQHSNGPSTSVVRFQRARTGRGSLLGLCGALLGAMLALLLVGCGASRSTLTRDPSVSPGASAAAAATATAGTIPLFALPYSESAPGCGADSAAWYVQAAKGVSCLTSPQRVHLTGEPYGSNSSCCYNEVELPFGSATRLSSTFRVTVDIAGLLGQAHSADDSLIARLVVRLRPAKGLVGPSPAFVTGLLVGGDGSVSYDLSLAGRDAVGGYDAANLTRPVTVSTTVDDYSAAIALNGATYLQRPLTTPVTVAAIALQVVGPAGDSVEYSNLKVEQVTGGSPPVW